MTIIRDASTMYASMFSLVVFLILFESRYPRKKTLVLTLSLMGPLMLANFALLFLLGPVVMGSLVLLTCSLPSMIFFFFLAKHRDGRFFFTFCFADTIMLEIIDLTSIADFFLGNTYIFLSVSRLILCPVLALVIYKWIRPTYRELQNRITRGWYAFALIALLFYILMSMLTSVPTHIVQRPEQLPALLLLLVLIPVIYIHIFRTLIHQQKVHEVEARDNILQLQVANMRSRIEEFSAASTRAREERHDFRHTLQTISALAEKGKTEEIRNLIRTYTETVPVHTTESYCDHPVIDAVLSAYLEKARRKDIRTSVSLDLPPLLPVNESELATVFANAIENAIHACEKIPQEARCLEVKAIQEPCFMLQVRNSFDGHVIFDADGVPVAARKGHGFGTRSIVTFCEKHGGFYEFKAEGTEFFLRLIFE